MYAAVFEGNLLYTGGTDKNIFVYDYCVSVCAVFFACCYLYTSILSVGWVEGAVFCAFFYFVFSSPEWNREEPTECGSIRVRLDTNE